MTLYDELYFEIEVYGKKSEIKDFIDFLTSGELDDFFEFTDDYIDTDDEYDEAADKAEVMLRLSSDDYGIEISKFDTDDFLEIFCKAGKRLYLKGQLFDADNAEYNFVSEEGNPYYVNALLLNEEENEEEEAD